MGKWVYPVADPVVVTSPYGMRVHPVAGIRTMHYGTDYRAYEGTEVYAASGGVVTAIARMHPVGGNWVQIRTDSGHIISYSHLSRIDVPRVGYRVRKGSIVGLSGSTGSATAAHLHFGMKYNGVWMDPHAFLKGATVLTDTPSSGRDKDGVMRRYDMRKTSKELIPHRWNTIPFTELGGTSAAFGPCEFDTSVVVAFNAPSGTQVRGRFYKINYKTGKRTYTYDVESKVDSPVTKGSTMRFGTSFKGELKTDERLRFEVYPWEPITMTSSAYRTDEK